MTTTFSGKDPFQLNISNVSQMLGKISLNRDLVAFLTKLDAKLQVTFDPASRAPTIRVLDSDGKAICSVSDFEKLGGYRRIIADAVRSAEKINSANARLETTAKLMKLFEVSFKNEKIPERVSQKNASRKIELEMTLKSLNSNKELLMKLPDSENFSEYILETIRVIELTLATEMIATIGDIDLNSEKRSRALFEAGIPKFLYGKLTTKLNPDIVDLKHFLFPKNNFLKNISFTTEELRDEKFCLINERVLRNSQHLRSIVLMEDFLLPLDNIPKDAATQEQVKETINQFMWTLHKGGPASEIIRPRLEGKSPPNITLEKPTGKENDIPRVKRLVRHHLTKISSNFLMLLNGLVLTDDPCAQFWTKLYSEVYDWELSPSKSIYDYIVEQDPEHTKFQEIVDFSNPAINEIIIEILMMKCGRYEPTIKKAYMHRLRQLSTKKFVETVPLTQLNETRVGIQKGKEIPGDPGQIESASESSEVKKNLRKIPGENFTMEDIQDTRNITLEDKEKAKIFLNIRPKVAKKKQPNALVVKLDKNVARELRSLETVVNKHFHESIREWIIKSFPSGGARLQKVAADFVIGAVINQPELLEEFQEDDEYSESSHDNWRDD